MGSSGLVGGAIIGDAAASANLMRHVIGRDRITILSALSCSKMRELAHEYRDFAFYSTPQNVMYAVSQGIPVILLAHFFGIAIAGHYALGLRLIQAPSTLIRAAVYQVLLQKMSESYNHGKDLHPLLVSTTIGMTAVVILPAIIVFIWGPLLFAWILGERWLVAGEYARWLVLLMIPWFCNVPSSILARVLKQQRNLFVLEVATLACKVIALLLGALFLNPLGTVILSTSVGALIYIFLIVWIGRLAFQQDRKTALENGGLQARNGEGFWGVVKSCF
jgi:O-antigen/teichoic acid export membrane protein